MFADGDEITWNARVRTFLVLWPRSTLRLTSSPSRNVTLITLLPRRRQLLSTGAFAKSGLAVATELRDRLARHLRASPISPAAVQVSSATPADTS